MHVDVNQQTAGEFFSDPPEGPIVMLNLLRFREAADYTDFPELAPATPLSGAAAYRRYMAHAEPFLRAVGGEVVFLGAGGLPLIGPRHERWDLVLLVRYPSADAFLSFSANDAYLEGLGHRFAALADSRLLPMVERDYLRASGPV